MTVLDDNTTMTMLDGVALADKRIPADWPGVSRSREITAAGLRWHVQQHGDTGPTVLLLHGAGASLHSWAGLVTELSPDHRLIAIDLPGHGFSDAFSAGNYTLTRTARAIAELQRALNASPALIVGHSAGAAIAMQMLVDAAHDGASGTPGIVAINPAILPFSGLAGIAFPLLAKIGAGSRLFAGLIASRASATSQVERLINGTGSQLDAEGIGRYQWLMQRTSHVRAVLSMMAGWRLDALQPALRRLDPPMHFIIGERDRAVPPSSVAGVAQRLGNTGVTRLAGYGHLVHEEAPAVVAATLRQNFPPSAGGRT